MKVHKKVHHKALRYMWWRAILPVLLLGLAAGHVICAESGSRVVLVFDGDTVMLGDHRRIRYIGINAPEVAHENQKAEPWAAEAKKLNQRLVLGKTVRLESDARRFDQYGRHLAYVFLQDGTFVNRAIIEQGYAYFVYLRPNCRYDSQLLAAQQYAMEKKMGIWRSFQERPGPFLGNRASKRFHGPGCPFGRRTAKDNRLIFTTRWEAFRAGYAPCKKCQP